MPAWHWRWSLSPPPRSERLCPRGGGRCPARSAGWWASWRRRCSSSGPRCACPGQAEGCGGQGLRPSRWRVPPSRALAPEDGPVGSGAQRQGLGSCQVYPAQPHSHATASRVQPQSEEGCVEDEGTWPEGLPRTGQVTVCIKCGRRAPPQRGSVWAWMGRQRAGTSGRSAEGVWQHPGPVCPGVTWG